MSTATSRPRRRMSRADREQQMLNVAEQVVAEQGYRATSMDVIADRCGVSKPMLYEYFGSKDGLLMAVIARARADLYERTRVAMADASEPEDVLWRGMLAYFAFMDERSLSFTLLLQEPLVMPTATSEAIEDIRRQQSGLIAPIMSAFAPGAPEVVVEAFVEIIIGACERLALWRLRNPEVSAADAARYMTDFCWQGLGAYVSS